MTRGHRAEHVRRRCPALETSQTCALGGAAVVKDSGNGAPRGVFVDVEDHDARLLAGEQAGDGGADARTCACDDGHLARQLEHAPA